MSPITTASIRYDVEIEARHGGCIVHLTCEGERVEMTTLRQGGGSNPDVGEVFDTWEAHFGFQGDNARRVRAKLDRAWQSVASSERPWEGGEFFVIPSGV